MKRRINTVALLGNWKNWNMKLIFIRILIGAFGTVTEGLLKRVEDSEIRGRMESFQILLYWDRLEYWEDSWRLEVTCCHSNFSERPSSNADEKNSQGTNNNNNNNNVDLARKLKPLWNIKVTEIPIVVGVLGTVTKGLVLGFESLEVKRRQETTQITALLRSARILRRALETWGDLLSF